MCLECTVGIDPPHQIQPALRITRVPLVRQQYCYCLKDNLNEKTWGANQGIAHTTSLLFGQVYIYIYA